MWKYRTICLVLSLVLYGCSINSIHGIYVPYKHKLRNRVGGSWFKFYSNNRFAFRYITEVKEERSSGNYQIIGKKIEILSDTNTNDIPIKNIQSKNKNYGSDQYYFVVKIDSAFTFNNSDLKYFLIVINSRHDTLEYPIKPYDSISIKNNINRYGIMVKVIPDKLTVPPDYNLVYYTHLDSIISGNNILFMNLEFPYNSYVFYHTFNKEQFLIKNRRKIFFLQDNMTYYKK
jgi:hypothetical protein